MWVCTCICGMCWIAIPTVNCLALRSGDLLLICLHPATPLLLNGWLLTYMYVNTDCLNFQSMLCIYAHDCVYVYGKAWSERGTRKRGGKREGGGEERGGEREGWGERWTREEEREGEREEISRTSCLHWICYIHLFGHWPKCIEILHLFIVPLKRVVYLKCYNINWIFHMHLALVFQESCFMSSGRTPIASTANNLS